jgi:hypothetical protein
MASLDSGTLAVARLSFNPATKEIHECDIEINSNVSWSTDGGGIGANRDNPGRYFYDNAIMGIELMEVA